MGVSNSMWDHETISAAVAGANHFLALAGCAACAGRRKRAKEREAHGRNGQEITRKESAIKTT